MLDMHSHPYNRNEADESRRMSGFMRELKFRHANDIATCFSSSGPKEWAFIKAGVNSSAGRPADMISFGIHPWDAHRWSPADYMDIYRECTYIGEIGLDTLWCDVPYETQKKVFLEQLQIAADLHKSILLHTKNCEPQIADIVKDFPENICVHWYSGDIETFERFADMGCSFTFGPDTAIYFDYLHNGDPGSFCPPEALQAFSRIEAMLKRLPADRVFTETDGLDAILWAYDELALKQNDTACEDLALQSAAENDRSKICSQDDLQPSYSLIAESLSFNSRGLASVYNLSADAFLHQLQDNLSSFCGFSF